MAGVLEARRLLEPRVAQLAALHIDQDDVQRLESSINQLRSAADNLERFIYIEPRFHLAIARATKNSTILELMRVLFRRLEIVRNVTMYASEETARVIMMHERTLAAICSGDPEKIEAVMDEHLGFSETLWDQATRRTTPPTPDPRRSEQATTAR
jgi:DNA-binding FadR family transcriptional regulator